MKIFVIVSCGLEDCAEDELKHFGAKKIVKFAQVLSCEMTKEQLDATFQSLRSIKKILIAVDNKKDFASLNVGNFAWKDVLKESFKLEIKHVKEKRDEKMKTLAKNLFLHFDKAGIEQKIDLKEPDLEVLLFFNGEEYFLGVDLAKKDLSSRDYRLFSHSGSFKGDISYYFVWKSRLKKKDKLLVGMAKDGAIAIEATLSTDYEVEAFTLGKRNFMAARKNVKIAKSKVNLHNYALDELDTRYDQFSFDKAIFYLTSKDEGQINELYYQLKYVLKKGGLVLIITRSSFELPISSSFVLEEKSSLRRGDGFTNCWLVRKK